MLKMPVDARKATEATGSVLDSTLKRVKEHDAAGMGRFGIAVGAYQKLSTNMLYIIKKKRISNIEQGISNVEGKEKKRMKKERKRMNM